MTKVTYIFGAGASCKALPMVQQMPDRILKMTEELQKDYLLLRDDAFFDNVKDKTRSQLFYQKQLVDDMLWLQNISRGHASVDTLAKKLYITKSPELKRLKMALTLFMLLEQIWKPVDQRYDTFFASIIDVSPTNLPKNIRIMSWNYDLQFEIALNQYGSFKSLSEVQIPLNVVTKHDIDPYTIEYDVFTLAKINGSAASITINPKRHQELIHQFKTGLTKESVQELINIYPHMTSWEVQWFSLSFAWEQPEPKFLDGLRKRISDTDILVIIGYSMPYFNRDIDKLLFNGMKPIKVYLQTIPGDIEKFKARYKATIKDLGETEIIPYPETEQFLLPNEL